MAYRKVDDTSLASVAEAIRSKGGTSDTLMFPDGFVNAISAIQAGGATPSAKWNDVRFIDYDGSVLYSYSLEEAQTLTELPALPTHDGLICQGWNWTLEAIKEWNRPISVGAMYITDDGATRLHIRIVTVGRMTFPLYIEQTVENGVSIDWGDGSAIETLAGTGEVNTSHTYTKPGDYVISLMPDDECKLSLGNEQSGENILGMEVESLMLHEVYIGKNVTSISENVFWNYYSLVNIIIPKGVTSIGYGAFYNCLSLVNVTIPNGVTSIGDDAFNNCSSLASIIIPNGVIYIGASAFNNCPSLASIIIPNGITSIGNYTFSRCHSLVSIIIPNGVTSIGDNAFEYCSGMRYYDFSECTGIPTLTNQYGFKKIPRDCQILIPSTLLDEWKTATNWTKYASNMVAV